jgi:hypothetical protein
LKQLGYTPVNPDEQVYFDCLVESPVDERRDRVRELFSARAEQAMNTGQTSAAHDLWVRAGWDLGAEPMKAFADLLERVCESAGKAQRTALSRLAETHRACFRQRYGI